MAHFKEERTLVIVKPDGVQRGLIGEVIKRFERVGLKLVGAKMMVASPEHIEQHYTLDPNWRRANGEKTIKAYRDKGLTPPSEDPLVVNSATLNGLKVYLSSGPVVCMVWQGAHAVQIVRKLAGGTEPLASADIGTIRGDFALDSYQMSDVDKRATRNVVHASGSVSEATDEIAHWFKPGEVISYRLLNEAIIYAPELGSFLGD